MAGTIESVNPNPIRNLKAIAQTVHGYDMAPTAQEFAYVLDLRENHKLEKECEKQGLTDRERDKLLDWLKLEIAEKNRRQSEAQKDRLQKLPLTERVKIDSRLTGYMVLPCGHLRRRVVAFSITRPTEIVCIYRGCGKRYRFEKEKMVEVK